MFFDSKLKTKAALKDYKNISGYKENQKKTALHYLLVIFTVFYILVIPLLDTDQWCLDALEPQRGNLPIYGGIFLDCDTPAKQLKMPYSGLPSALPLVTAIFDLITLAFFSFVKWRRFKNRRKDEKLFYRDSIFAALVVISVIDIVVSLILFESYFVVGILRAPIIVLLYRSQQDFFWMVALNVKDSFAMLICILIWVFYFAAFGHFLFQDMMEGMMNFSTFTQSYWSMFVCLTVENYPDVMLFAQEKNSAYALFFVFFILVGCFYLLSVLLAVIFDNFKSRIDII